MEPRTVDSLNAFVRQATGYCALIDSVSDRELGMFLSSLESQLPTLLVAALALPSVAPTTDGARGSISDDEMKPIYRAIGVRLGPHDGYWSVYDPAGDRGTDAVGGSLADDLGDIYRDVKSGLIRWQLANDLERQDIVWAWRFDFASHWGRHLVDALRVVHWLRHAHFVGVTPEAQPPSL
jgi:Domain of unknown function (DUF5063)